MAKPLEFPLAIPSPRPSGTIMAGNDLLTVSKNDLRRTLGSHMAISGPSLPIIDSALNHKSLRSTEIYARLSQDAVRSAVDSATHLLSIL